MSIKLLKDLTVSLIIALMLCFGMIISDFAILVATTGPQCKVSAVTCAVCDMMFSLSLWLSRREAQAQAAGPRGPHSQGGARAPARQRGHLRGARRLRGGALAAAQAATARGRR